MLSAMSTGHDGSLSTVHAGSPEEALRRVETLALMAGLGLPHAAVRDQVAGALDLVVHQARLPGGARAVVSVAEVVRVAGGPAMREVYALRDGRPLWRTAGRALLERLGAAEPPRGRSGSGGVTLAIAMAGWRARSPCSRRGRGSRPSTSASPRGRSGAGWRRCAGRGRRVPPSGGGWPRWPRASCSRAAGWSPVLGGRGVWRGRAVRGLTRARRTPRAAEGAARGVAPAVARALADALAGGHSVRGALAAAATTGGLESAAAAELRAALGRPRRRRGHRGRARTAARATHATPPGTPSSPRSSSSATPAATSRVCSAASPSASSRPGERRPTPAPPPPRPVSPPGSSRPCPRAPPSSPSSAHPATSAPSSDPLTTTLLVTSVVLQAGASSPFGGSRRWSREPRAVEAARRGAGGVAGGRPRECRAAPRGRGRSARRGGDRRSDRAEGRKWRARRTAARAWPVAVALAGLARVGRRRAPVGSAGSRRSRRRRRRSARADGRGGDGVEVRGGGRGCVSSRSPPGRSRPGGSGSSSCSPGRRSGSSSPTSSCAGSRGAGPRRSRSSSRTSPSCCGSPSTRADADARAGRGRAAASGAARRGAARRRRAGRARGAARGGRSSA